jgi:hypothetical protein
MSRVAISFAIGLVSCESALSADARPREAVEAAAKRLAEAVRARSAERILSFVAASGVACVDAIVSRAEVEQDLRSPDTWLYAYFLDGPMFRNRHADRYYKASLAEIVAGNDWEVEVLRDRPPDFPCVHFLRKADPSVWAEICFAWRRHGWVFAGLPNCL